MIKTEIFDRTYFDAESSVCCGQVFRYEPTEKGFLLFSGSRACLIRSVGECTSLTANAEDVPYFINYFDTERDYSEIHGAALKEGGTLARAAAYGKGIRIFNQDAFEALVCFIISQNNHIPRIRGTVERLCAALGERGEFCGREYFTFPLPEKMAEKDAEFYRAIGAGYRAEYLVRTVRAIADGAEISPVKELTEFYGVGQKVADCVSLFAFHKTERFPVDTWLEKVYREDFGGTEKSRAAITRFFEGKFGANSGYFQQYLFYYKREQAARGKK